MSFQEGGNADHGLVDDLWKKCVEPLKEQVRQRARDRANGSELSANDVIDAIRELIPTGKSSLIAEQRTGWFNKNVTGFIGITAGLAIIFGLLGIVPFIKDNVSKDYVTVANSFLEIAKIFAGAIVGGAAGAAATRR